MADQKVKVYDGSTWQDIESNAKLPVAASDGKSQVDGQDGLIIIENLEDNGEIGLHWDTKAGSRWRTVVEEGLQSGDMTFYNASNESVFTLRQNGEVRLEQGGPDSLGGIAATESFVRALMNTFPLIDDGNDTQSSFARVDTDNDGPNMKQICSSVPTLAISAGRSLGEEMSAMYALTCTQCRESHCCSGARLPKPLLRATGSAARLAWFPSRSR